MEGNTNLKAWQHLQDLVQAEATRIGSEEASNLKYKWQPGKLIVMGPFQVEACFDLKHEKYQIQFDRFGAQLGAFNFELPPGAIPVRPEVWTAEVHQSGNVIFWILDDGSTLTSEVWAKRIVDRLSTFHEKYKLASIGIHI